MAETRTFRVFVSSTFRDLEAERNHLHEHVYPDLRRLCEEEHGARFQPIDLRWGISEEASLDQQAMNVCLREVQRCLETTPRPNFVVLLGNRHGWLAPPPQVPADEFDALLDILEDQWDEIGDELHDGLEHTYGKTRAGVEDLRVPRDGGSDPLDLSMHQDVADLVNHWYPRDGNAVPPEHCLRPREKGGLYQEFDAWEPVEWVLHTVLASAARRAGFDDSKYHASATEQEILHGALGVGAVDGHAFCFVRDLTGTHPDAQAAKAQAWDEQQHPILSFFDPDQGSLDGLKQELEGELPYKAYTAEWDPVAGRPTTAHLEALADDVRAALTQAIVEQLEHPVAPERWTAEPDRIAADALLDDEGRAHRAFAEDRCRVFVGREDELAAIAAHLRSDDARPLVVAGGGGMGKSALLAEALRRAQQDHDRAQIVYRFIGATAASSDGRSLLQGLCRELARRAGADEAEVPTDYQELVTDFRQRLAGLGAAGPLVVFLDSLDQLSASQGARGLTWLPATMPAGVRVVVSTRPEDTLKPLVKAKAQIADLGPMPASDGREILRRWLADAGRTLQPDQQDAVLAAFAGSAGNPLYLQLAFQEARRWKSDEQPEELATGVEGIIAHNTFARLKSEDNHGEVLVAHALGYLAASRYGLAEDELLDLLSRDPEVYEWFVRGAKHIPPDLHTHAQRYLGTDDDPTAWLDRIRKADDRSELEEFLKRVLPDPNGPKLPVVLWSRFAYDLRRYLTQRQADRASLITFFHRELEDVASTEFLATRAADYHGRLADYFHPRCVEENRYDWANASLRGLSELPYHLVSAQLWAQVEDTLTDFDFLEAKASRVAMDTRTNKDGTEVTTYNGVRRLQDDFDLALREMGHREAADRPRTIVTVTDFGDGFVVRCPHCNVVHVFTGECAPCAACHLLDNWLGQQLSCPNEHCHGPLKVNAFTVGRDRTTVAYHRAPATGPPVTAPEQQSASQVTDRGKPTTATPASKVTPSAEPDASKEQPSPREPVAAAPDLPLVSGAKRLLDEAHIDGRSVVQHWLLALLRRYGPMAESLSPGLDSQAVARELAGKLRAGDTGDPLTRDELVGAATRHAQSRGSIKVTERDLVTVILAAAGYEVREE